jgi:hypothetical protein
MAIGSLFGKSRLNMPPESSVKTLMINPTLDLKDLPQFMDPQKALRITNYLVTSDQGLLKRKGLEGLFTVAGGNKITMLEKFTDDIYIYGYSTIVAAYVKSTGASTIIKNNFTTSDPFSGVTYGGYFFVCNGGDKIGRISRTLNFDGQTSNFTVGAVVTGGTSGATAIILENLDAGATGTLTLSNIVGTFVDNELLTDSSGGSATENGVVTWTFTSITGAPKAKVLKAVSARLYAGNLSSDPTAVAYSAIDDGTNPPFTNFTVATVATGPGLLNYRNAGAVNAIDSLGNNIIVLANDGKWSFTTTTIDSGGTLTKVDNFVLQRIDFGGCRASLSTPAGMVYANEAGLWLLASIGQSNVPFSEQETEPSLLLGISYFQDVDLTNADIAYDARINTVFLTCAKNSTENNLVIVYNLGLRTFAQITGWNINRFMNDNGVIYGASALATEVWQCFEGNDDDGADIWTDFYQELRTGELWTRQELLGEYIQGYLSQGTELRVCFDIFDVKGNFHRDVLCFDWTAQSVANLGQGWSQISWGSGVFGGGGIPQGLVNSFDGARGYIRNYQRLRIHITGHDKLSHQINWFSVQARSKIDIRRRTLSQTT